MTTPNIPTPISYKNAGVDIDAGDALIERIKKETDAKNRNDLIEKALELSHTDVSHIPLHNQIIPWALKKNVDVVHRADNRIDWRLVKVN